MHPAEPLSLHAVNEETLFHLVLGKPAAQRAGFLVEVCADPILRERVSVLIAAHGSSGASFTPLNPAFAAATDPGAIDWVGPCGIIGQLSGSATSPAAGITGVGTSRMLSYDA